MSSWLGYIHIPLIRIWLFIIVILYATLTPCFGLVAGVMLLKKRDRGS